MKKILLLIGLATACLIIPKKSNAQIQSTLSGDSAQYRYSCVDSTGSVRACDSAWWYLTRITPATGAQVFVDSGRTTSPTAVFGGAFPRYRISDAQFTSLTTGRYALDIVAWGGTFGSQKLTTPTTIYFSAGIDSAAVARTSLADGSVNAAVGAGAGIKLNIPEVRVVSAETTTTLLGNVNGNVAGSVGSVTGAVGSVTAEVRVNSIDTLTQILNEMRVVSTETTTTVLGNVNGNVAGNVTGSVGSVTAGGITAASIANGAIDSATFADDVRANFLNRVIHTGTAAGAAATTLTLAANSFAADEIVGNILYVRSGTGAGQARRIVDFNAATEVATVDSAFTTTPTGAIYFIYPDADRTILANTAAHGGAAANINLEGLTVTATGGAGITATGAANQPAVNLTGGTGNANALSATGVGSGAGFGLVGGATGAAMDLVTTGTGPGLNIITTGANVSGIDITTEGKGIDIVSNSDNALYLASNAIGAVTFAAGTAGNGVTITGGGTGLGVAIAGGNTAGHGMRIAAGSGVGGVGLILRGGGTSGSAESLSVVAGNGITFVQAGTNSVGFKGAVDTVRNSLGAVATIDSSLLWRVHQHAWGKPSASYDGTYTDGDSLTTAQRVVTASLQSLGAGPYTVRIFVLDSTTGCVNAVEGYNISVRDSATQTQYTQTSATGAAGYVQFNVQGSTTYFVRGNKAFYRFATNADTTLNIAAANFTDTVCVVGITLASPPAGGQVAITSNIYDITGDSIEGAVISFALNQFSFYSSDDTTNLVAVAQERQVTTDVNGDFTINVYPTTKLVSGDRRSPSKYQVRVSLPDGSSWITVGYDVTLSHTPTSQKFNWNLYRWKSQ